MSRFVPLPLIPRLGAPYRTLARCWVIRPRVGPVEAYTSLNRNLALPAYGDVPAMTYLCAGGVESTTIPARLNLGKAGIEFSVLAFDRGRLLRGYYRDAVFEAFIVDYTAPEAGRDVIVSGKLGAIEVGPVAANIELLPWNALAEMAHGRTCNQLCDVGQLPGEQFGTGRCRNVILQDGPLRANWTVLSTITAVTNAHAFSVSHGTTAITGAALHSQFDARLERGDVEFLVSEEGGDNAGVEMQVKSTTLQGSNVSLVLTGDLPFIPQVGDKLNLVAGCRRTLNDCKFFDNVPNNQGFGLLPGKIGVFNEKEEEG